MLHFKAFICKIILQGNEGRINYMERRFLNLSKKIQIIILICVWLLAIISFVLSGIFKANNSDAMWVIILFTILGMGFGTVGTCLFIYFITGKPQEGEEKIDQQQTTEQNDADNNNEPGEPYTQG